MFKHHKHTRCLGLSLAFALVFGSWSSAQAEPKVGVIELKKVFEGYYKRKQADAQLKDTVADYEKMRKDMLEDYEKGKQEFDKLQQAANDQALAADERDKRKTAAQKKFAELRQIEQDMTQFDRTSRSTLSEKQRRLLDRILEDIKEVVAAKAKEKGFTLVLDTTGDSLNQAPVVLFSSGENDLTQAVISELNSRGPLDLPAAGDAKPAKPEEKKEGAAADKP